MQLMPTALFARASSQGHEYWMRCVQQAVVMMHRETVKVLGGRPAEEKQQHTTNRFLVGGTLESHAKPGRHRGPERLAYTGSGPPVNE